MYHILRKYIYRESHEKERNDLLQFLRIDLKEVKQTITFRKETNKVDNDMVFFQSKDMIKNQSSSKENTDFEKMIQMVINQQKNSCIETLQIFFKCGNYPDDVKTQTIIKVEKEFNKLMQNILENVNFQVKKEVIFN